MNILDLANKVYFEKKGQRKLDNGEFEEYAYIGTEQELMLSYFDKDTEISFDKSFKAIKNISSMSKDSTSIQNDILKIEIEIQSLLIRLKIPSISVQKHEETTKELNELIEKKIELYTKKEDVEINFIFKT
ncbi:MAG: hypothetical protein ACRC31_01795, partial [Cetobacterium sp.]